MFLGTNLLTTIGFDLHSQEGYPRLTLVDERNTSSDFFEGRFGLLAYGAPIALVQTGEIPPDARLMTFGKGLGLWVPYINGTPVEPFTPTQFFVAPYAGQTVELRLQTVIGGQNFLDDIRFAPIPEPSTGGLLGLGGLALLFSGAWRWRSR